MDIWIKITVIVIFSLLLYKEILNSAALKNTPLSTTPSKNEVVDLKNVSFWIG